MFGRHAVVLAMKQLMMRL